MLIQKFTVREIIFIAILSGALTLAGIVTMPLVMSVTLFGARNLVSSIFLWFFCNYWNYESAKVWNPYTYRVVSCFNFVVYGAGYVFLLYFSVQWQVKY